jgi:hypothetical protein
MADGPQMPQLTRLTLIPFLHLSHLHVHALIAFIATLAFGRLLCTFTPIPQYSVFYPSSSCHIVYIYP